MAMADRWENVDKSRRGIEHYSVHRLVNGEGGMQALREAFPEAKADEMNVVLFSTSGVHGTYNTIEDAERFLRGENPEGFAEVTFVIVQPRRVSLFYGVCDPANQDDIDFLKRLRASSHAALAIVGDTEA
jgi:hypothetical protein